MSVPFFFYYHYFSLIISFIYLFFFLLSLPTGLNLQSRRLSVDLNESRWTEPVHARRRLAKSANVSPDTHRKREEDTRQPIRVHPWGAVQLGLMRRVKYQFKGVDPLKFYAFIPFFLIQCMLFLNNLFFIIFIDKKLFVQEFAATLNSLRFNLRISTIPFNPWEFFSSQQQRHEIKAWKLSGNWDRRSWGPERNLAAPATSHEKKKLRFQNPAVSKWLWRRTYHKGGAGDDQLTLLSLGSAGICEIFASLLLLMSRLRVTTFALLFHFYFSNGDNFRERELFPEQSCTVIVARTRGKWPSCA